MNYDINNVGGAGKINIEFSTKPIFANYLRSKAVFRASGEFMPVILKNLTMYFNHIEVGTAWQHMADEGIQFPLAMRYVC